MRVGLLADLHGNADAFGAIRCDFPPDVNLFLFAGDLAGYYPFLDECLQLWRSLDIRGVRGNHDQVLIDSSAQGWVPPEYEAQFGSGLRRGLESLDSASLELISALPIERTEIIDGRRVRILHGAPWDMLEGRVYPDFDEWERFGGVDADVLVLGHSHYPMTVRLGPLLVVNPGSAGQPRDRRPGACYAILDMTTGDIEHRRVPYDTSRLISDARRHNPELPYLAEVLTRSA